jgi:hypothetical protein
VVSDEVFDEEDEKFEHLLWLLWLLSVSDSESREAENIARIQKESNKGKCGRLYVQLLPLKEKYFIVCIVYVLPEIRQWALK